MTTQTEKQLRVLFWTVLAGLILLTAPKLGGQVVFRPEFEALQADIQDVKYLVCKNYPTDSKCARSK